ncbi:MAG: killer suppression protein HigA [Acidobacteriota bacterium]|nr:killer suppression protein HigA [Acidobacteriota bacterium]
MEILFADKNLRRLCEEERRAKRSLGQAGARKLRARLADLMAASTVRDLVAGRPHALKGDRSGHFAIDLDRGRRLVFEPGNEPTPRSSDGGILWSEVTVVRILFIGDYHD